MQNFSSISDAKNGINFSAEQKGSGILTVDVLNMYSDNVYIRTDRLYRVNIDVREDYLLQHNDILFVRSSLKQEGVGWPALFQGHSEPMTFCGFLIRVRLKSAEIDPRFLINTLRLPTVRSLLVSKSDKVAITNINQASIAALPIPIPPIEEQRTIAATLRACDETIAALEREAAAHDELFKALLEELMMGRLRATGLIEH